MEELEYFRRGTLLVTSSRIEINGQTFAVRNVGSVMVAPAPKPILSSIFSSLALLIGITAASERLDGGSLFFIVIGLLLGAYAYYQSQLRRLVLVAGGGQIVALNSTDARLMEQTRAAIASAISGR